MALKAEERRRLFEEAAGIGLYRSRREEALRRLESTQRNLERVQDILAELLPRVRSLERQARRAHEYEQVRDDLKSALRTWYGFHWFRVQKQVTEAQAEAGQQAQRRDDLRAEQQGLDQLLMRSRGQIETLRAELHAFSQRMSARYAERETLGRRVAVAQERLRGLAEQDGVAKAETASLEAERDELLVRLTAARDETTGRQQTLFAAEEEFHRLQGPADLAGPRPRRAAGANGRGPGAAGSCPRTPQRLAFRTGAGRRAPSIACGAGGRNPPRPRRSLSRGRRLTRERRQ